jgi:hypothetical protein
MDRIEIDRAAIASLGHNLGILSQAFNDANTRADTIAAAVGHSNLSSTVRDFAHKWDDKRQKITDAVTALSQASTEVANAWGEMDQEGANALRGEEG